MSLLYRLAGVGVLALCVLADRAHPGWAGVVLAEVMLVSPARDLPAVTAVPDASPYAVMVAEPDGAVLDLPPVASREYLYEQTLHGHPRVGSLNSGLNLAGLKVGKAARDVRAGDLPPSALADIATGFRVRWVVQHRNQLMEEEWVGAAAAMREHGTIVAEDDRVRIIQLY